MTNLYLIACMPKSGSTWLRQCYIETLRASLVNFSMASARMEQDLHEQALFPLSVDKLYIAQHHCRATKNSLHLISKYNILPTILVRNLFDIVISYRDHLFKEDMASPSAYIDPPQFRQLSPEKQIDFIITFALPWYFQFYVSWYLATLRGEINPTRWVNYETFVMAPLAILGQLLPSDNLVIAHGGTRMNKGINGRGRALSTKQIEKILYMASLYPDIDFSRVLRLYNSNDNSYEQLA